MLLEARCAMPHAVALRSRARLASILEDWTPASVRWIRWERLRTNAPFPSRTAPSAGRGSDAATRSSSATTSVVRRKRLLLGGHRQQELCPTMAPPPVPGPLRSQLGELGSSRDAPTLPARRSWPDPSRPWEPYT